MNLMLKEIVFKCRISFTFSECKPNFSKHFTFIVDISAYSHRQQKQKYPISLDIDYFARWLLFFYFIMQSALQCLASLGNIEAIILLNTLFWSNHVIISTWQYVCTSKLIVIWWHIWGYPAPNFRCSVAFTEAGQMPWAKAMTASMCSAVFMAGGCAWIRKRSKRSTREQCIIEPLKSFDS